MIACDLLMIGSSIFHQWETAADCLPGRNVINEAVGGTETHDWVERLPEVLGRVRPRALAYYCGSNDIGRGKSADGVIARTLQTFDLLHQQLEIPVLYFSIIKAPEKRARWTEVDRVNREIRSFIRSGLLGGFLDLNPLFFDENGGTRDGLYQDDRLHLTPEAYQAMNHYCGPKIQDMLEAETV
jgi:lysophospholipase L1-like esterase